MEKVVKEKARRQDISSQGDDRYVLCWNAEEFLGNSCSDGF